MRYATCHLTWTCQPDGLKARFQRSQRVRALNLLFYALGLSYEATAQVMTALGAVESDTSVYRDLVGAMGSVKALHRRGRRQVRVAGKLKQLAREVYEKWERVWMDEQSGRVELGGLL